MIEYNMKCDRCGMAALGRDLPKGWAIVDVSAGDMRSDVCRECLEKIKALLGKATEKEGKIK